ncbi:MAG: phage head-tail connector protein [Phycisphaerae bacterium]|nr:phage head-tail connector protein [Phycisphaerae bacterium]
MVPDRHSISVVTPPTTEPMTLAQAKAHLRITFTNDDDYIADLITAARVMLEDLTHRQFMSATIQQTFDAFPYPYSLGLCNDPVSSYGPGPGYPNRLQPMSWLRDYAILIERPPLQSVTSIAYIDASGNPQTMNANSYTVDAASEPGRILPAIGTYWPPTLGQIDSVTVTYVAGYSDNAPELSKVRTAMRLLIGNWYENREAVGSKLLGVEVPFAVQSLMQSLFWGDYR